MSVTDIDVRLMERSELDAATDVYVRSLTGSIDWFTAEQRHSDAEYGDYFRKQVVPVCETWVALVTGRVVAVMTLEEDEWLDRLYVDPEFQRQGVGSRLLQQAKELRPDGLRLVTLERNEPARRFYERHGFVLTGHGQAQDPPGEPDVQYRWQPQA